MKKYYKGDKYIYLLMAYRLCQNNRGQIVIGEDTGMVGGQNYYRKFRILEHNNQILLIETKTSRSFADFSKTYQVGYTLEDKNKQRPAISDYMNEHNENGGKVWVH